MVVYKLLTFDRNTLYNCMQRIILMEKNVQLKKDFNETIYLKMISIDLGYLVPYNCKIFRLKYLLGVVIIVY